MRFIMFIVKTPKNGKLSILKQCLYPFFLIFFMFNTIPKVVPLSMEDLNVLKIYQHYYIYLYKLLKSTIDIHHSSDSTNTVLITPKLSKTILVHSSPHAFYNALSIKYTPRFKKFSELQSLLLYNVYFGCLVLGGGRGLVFGYLILVTLYVYKLFSLCHFFL